MVLIIYARGHQWFHSFHLWNPPTLSLDTGLLVWGCVGKGSAWFGDELNTKPNLSYPEIIAYLHTFYDLYKLKVLLPVCSATIVSGFMSRVKSNLWSARLIWAGNKFISVLLVSGRLCLGTSWLDPQLENGTPAITPANKNIFLRGNAKSMNGFSLRLYPGSQNLFKVYCGINETGHSKTHFDSDQFCCCIFVHESIYLSKYMINTSQ